MSKPRQKASKTKLKTMNEVSAAEAQRLCHAAMDRGARAPAFPNDVAGRDFYECLKLHCEIEGMSAGAISKRSLEVEELARRRGVSEESQILAEEDLDELFFRAAQQRKIVEVIRRNKNRVMSLDEIAVEVGGVDQSTKTVQNILTKIFKKTNSKNLRELARRLPLPLRS